MRLFPLMILVTLFSVGCGPSYEADLYPVHGTVMLDGAPLANARVEFRPTSGSAAGRGVTGYADETGAYRMQYLAANGCPAGTFDVVLFSGGEDGKRLKLDKESKKQLSVNVGPDQVEINFDLKSK